MELTDEITDAFIEISGKENIRDALSVALTRLMSWQCGYCGSVFATLDEGQAHTRECPDHPLSSAMAEIERLKTKEKKLIGWLGECYRWLTTHGPDGARDAGQHFRLITTIETLLDERLGKGGE